MRHWCGYFIDHQSHSGLMCLCCVVFMCVCLCVMCVCVCVCDDDERRDLFEEER